VLLTVGKVITVLSLRRNTVNPRYFTVTAQGRG